MDEIHNLRANILDLEKRVSNLKFALAQLNKQRVPPESSLKQKILILLDEEMNADDLVDEVYRISPGALKYEIQAAILPLLVSKEIEHKREDFKLRRIDNA